MKKRHSALAALAVVTALTLSACSGAPAATPAPNTGTPGSAAPAGSEIPEMEITIATTHPNNESDAMYVYCKTFAEQVTERTGGRVTFDIIGDSVLGADTEIAQGIAMGTLQMGITSNAAVFGYEASHQIFGLPFFFSDIQEAHAFIDSDLVAEMNELLYDDGLKVLSILDGGFRECLNNVRPITDMSAFAGLKWRVPSQDLYITLFNLLGANATPMSGAEVFTALQQKAIDGCEFPVSSIYNMQLYTAVKYIDLTHHQYAAWYSCVSDELWESLGEETQAIFMEATKAANEKARQVQEDSVETQLAEIETYGCVVNRDVDTQGMRQAVSPMYDSFRDSIGADYFDRAMELLESMR